MSKFHLPALHEAAHAVVAAYLHVPFSRVSIVPSIMNGKESSGHVWLTFGRFRKGPKPKRKTRRRLSYKARGERMSRENKWLYSRIAVVAMAARAQVELYDWDSEVPESSYGSDEEKVRSASRVVGIPESEYETWRLSALYAAQQIVELPHVAEAIECVAVNLEKEGTLRSKAVRSVLRFYESSTNAVHGG